MLCIRALLVVLSLILVGACSCCLWVGTTHRYTLFSHTIDIGNGRRVKVWAVEEHAPFEPVVRLGYYQIQEDGNVAVPGCAWFLEQHFLDQRHGGEYEFRVAFADSGDLACVYEAHRYQRDSSYILLYDAASGESWPRRRGSSLDPAVERKWRARYRRVCVSNPGLAFPASFD